MIVEEILWLLLALINVFARDSCDHPHRRFTKTNSNGMVACWSAILDWA
jgi:hypothetical protein